MTCPRSRRVEGGRRRALDSNEQFRMGLIRRHLGVWAFAWLSCQVASLSIAAPLWQALASETVECLGITAGDACPMRDESGQACPMHDGTNRPDASDECAMRALSHQPALALATIFSIPAVLLSATGTSADAQSAMLMSFVTPLHSASASVDSPPPRS